MIPAQIPHAREWIAILILTVAGWIVACLSVVIRNKRLVASERRLDPAIHVIALLSGGLAVLGFSIGVLIGNSLTPAVGGAISSLLTLFGGLSVYIFGKTEFYSRLLAALSLVILPFFVIYGADVGAASRVNFEQYQKQLDLAYEARSVLYKAQVDVESHRQKLAADAAAKQQGADNGTGPNNRER